MNVQVVTDPTGRVLWISPALPGRTHDLTAARAHRIIRISERQGVPILADRAYTGIGTWVTTGLKRPPGREPTPTRRTVNRTLTLAQARAPIERGMARLKTWQIFRRSRISPNRMTVITKAVLKCSAAPAGSQGFSRPDRAGRASRSASASLSELAPSPDDLQQVGELDGFRAEQVPQRVGQLRTKRS